MSWDDWYFDEMVRAGVVSPEQKVRGTASGMSSPPGNEGYVYTGGNGGVVGSCVYTSRGYGGGGSSPSILEAMKPAPKYAIDPWGGAPNFDGGFGSGGGGGELQKVQTAYEAMLAKEADHQRRVQEHREKQRMDAMSERQRIMMDAYRRIEADTYAITGNPIYVYDPVSMTARPASQQPLKALSDIEIEQIKAKAFAAGQAAEAERIAEEAVTCARAYEAREPLPIHRALSRMLHADERYENKAFMPGGLLARAGDMA